MVKTMVYLSGSMDGVSLEDGNGWRIKAEETLKEAGFDTYNPYSLIHDETTTPNEIYNRDIYYLNKSDIVLVNLDLPDLIKNRNIPFFTIGEMFIAGRDHKPIIAYTNCLDHRPSFNAIVTKSLKDLDSAISYIIENF